MGASDVAPLNVMQVAQIEIRCRVATITIAFGIDRTTAEFLLNQLPLEEDRRLTV